MILYPRMGYRRWSWLEVGGGQLQEGSLGSSSTNLATFSTLP